MDEWISCNEIVRKVTESELNLLQEKEKKERKEKEQEKKDKDNAKSAAQNEALLSEKGGGKPERTRGRKKKNNSSV